MPTLVNLHMFKPMRVNFKQTVMRISLLFCKFLVFMYVNVFVIIALGSLRCVSIITMYT